MYYFKNPCKGTFIFSICATFAPILLAHNPIELSTMTDTANCTVYVESLQCTCGVTPLLMWSHSTSRVE